MPVPLVGLGHGLLLSALVPFHVEPAIPNGVTFAQRDGASDGSIHLQGLHCALEWAVFDGLDDLDATLAQMGLEEDSDTRAAITAYLPTMRGKWHRYNGWAIAPVAIRYSLWPSDVTIILNRLVLIE